MPLSEEVLIACVSCEGIFPSYPDIVIVVKPDKLVDTSRGMPGCCDTLLQRSETMDKEGIRLF